MALFSRLGLIFAIVVISACASCKTVRAPIETSNQPVRDWRETLSVPPGSSLSDTDVQDIRVTTVKEIREPAGKLWFAGKGYANINGGSSSWFWQSSTPPQVEIEITDVDQLSACKTVLEQAKGSGKTVSLVGSGHFDGKRFNDNLVGIFQITHVNSCELSK